ncbi:insulinase family protein [Sulfurovum sp. bin170]|uniref:M16 family metallopeptidase n=1 Tax=Sulfurovum sp. bin170 TaxID=2695268 RepID=UPI0013DF7D7F|nr:pitrilysin family protein [Sulfurovum sp. bin170]NEW60483.1 insulinase family protein [Sulfurovum sp. bin170]
MANSLPTHYTKTLENGLEVVVIPMKNRSNVITTDIFYKVGSRNEVMGKSGIAHMLEHLNFKSTKNLEAGEFDKIVKSKGAINNASTSFDYTSYFIKSSSQNLPTSMELFAELMENLNLKDDEFQVERKVVAEERRVRTDNPPIGYLYFRLFNTHYVSHPYHWTPIGFMNDIQTWTIEDIREFHEKYYQPNNAILVVTGDIDKESVFKEAEAKFGKIKNKVKIPECKPVEPSRDGSIRQVIYKDNNTVDTIAIAYPIPNFEHKDQVVLSAISELMSSGKSSRLHKELIDNKQMVNTVYGYNMELTDDGIFLFMAIANPDIKIEDVEKEILEEIEKIKKGSVTKEELDKVKINSKADFVYSLESSSDVNSLFGSYLVRGNLKPLLEYEENLDKITPEMVTEVAKKYFNNDLATTLILRKSR